MERIINCLAKLNVSNWSLCAAAPMKLDINDTLPALTALGAGLPTPPQSAHTRMLHGGVRRPAPSRGCDTRVQTALILILFLLPIHKPARLAHQHRLTFRTRYLHVRLIRRNMRFAAAWTKWAMTGGADQRLFAEAAFDHGLLRQAYLLPATAMAPVSEM